MMTQDQHFKEAKNYMVGGVSAGGRVHPALKRALFLERADGCRLYDIDGNEWIDYHSSSGAAFLGYNHPVVDAAAREQVNHGNTVTLYSPVMVELAEKLVELITIADWECLRLFQRPPKKMILKMFLLAWRMVH